MRPENAATTLMLSVVVVIVLLVAEHAFIAATNQALEAA